MGGPPLLPHHARELHETSGITAAVVKRRGYRSITAAECAPLGFAAYQCGDGLLLPQWTLAGVQRGHKLKRDTPRTDKHGKVVKYEFPAGALPAFDVHPDVRHLLRDLETTPYFCEGIKKADAGASLGALFVDVGSVWMFLNRRLVVPDLDEIPLDGRPARVVYDSDILHKSSVAEALQRFCHALHRRGARVEVVYLPDGPNGEKTGVDDFLAGGGTLADLDALARPWNGEGPGVLLVGGDDDVAELRRQRDAARDDARALLRAILNPNVGHAELVASASVAVQALAKQGRGEVEPDGAVVLTAAEIADDWRAKPDAGDRLPATNPSGTRPRLARERVKGLVASAVERGLIRAAPYPITRRHRNGSTYRDTAWRVDPVPSIAAALNPWADYRPAERAARKPRSAAHPCPHCGEVHPLARRDYCAGCAGLIDERTVAPSRHAEPASDKRSEATMTDETVPSVPQYLVVRSFIGGNVAAPEEPAWLANVPDPPFDDRQTDEGRRWAFASDTCPPDRVGTAGDDRYTA